MKIIKIEANAIYELKFLESSVSPGNSQTRKIYQMYISPAKGYFSETKKSQNINPILQTPKFTLGIVQIKVKSLSTSFQW